MGDVRTESRHVDDRFLVELAHRGHRGAVEDLLLRYSAFARAKAATFTLVGGETEDLVQEALVGLVKAIRDYRPQEASFRTYAELCMTRQMITAVKVSTRNKHQPLNKSSRLDAASQDATDGLEWRRAGLNDLNDPEQQVIANERLMELLELVTTRLSPFETRVVAFHLSGYEASEISDMTGAASRSCENAVSRARRKLGPAFHARRSSKPTDGGRPTETGARPCLWAETDSHTSFLRSNVHDSRTMSGSHLAAEFAQKAASADAASPSVSNWGPAAAVVAEVLGRDESDVYPATVSKSGNLSVRAFQSKRAAKSPVMLAMWTGPDDDDFDSTIEAAHRHLDDRDAVVIAAREASGWTIRAVLLKSASSPPAKLLANWPTATVLQL